MANDAKQPCPCCETLSPPFFTELGIRIYHLCPDSRCGVAFLARAHHLEGEAEKTRYDLHHNDIEQQGYIDYLEPLLSRIRSLRSAGDQPLQALDFGCGPTESVRRSVVEPHFQWQSYDKYYFDQPEVLNKTYDVIAASEVFEHLKEPTQVFRKLTECLKPSGQIWIMTSLFDPEKIAFGGWHYRRDPTHIVFFTRACFVKWAEDYGFETPQFYSDRVIGLIRKVN